MASYRQAKPLLPANPTVDRHENPGTKRDRIMKPQITQISQISRPSVLSVSSVANIKNHIGGYMKKFKRKLTLQKSTVSDLSRISAGGVIIIPHDSLPETYCYGCTLNDDSQCSGGLCTGGVHCPDFPDW